MNNSRSDTLQAALVRAAEELHWAARRWAATLTSNPVDATVCDVAIRICDDHGANFTRPTTRHLAEPIYATDERRESRGEERIRHPFRLPVTLADAVEVLLGLARNYVRHQQALGGANITYLTTMIVNAEDAVRAARAATAPNEPPTAALALAAMARATIPRDDTTTRPSPH